MRELHLWMREDGQPPKVIGEGCRPPGPGVVLAIKARNRADALGLLAQLRELEAAQGGSMSLEVRSVLARAGHADLLDAIREVPESDLVRPYKAGE